METKRLFIGGLHSDITEVELRDRFKSFGSVLSVEIKKRTDEKGHPVKTFAYLDIKLSESDFKRCVSLLSKSKWKGGCLKVQAAKESFLTRLERERRRDHDQSNARPLDKDTTKVPREKRIKEMQAIPKTLPKAVPGTPLPRHKNWVVGKYGRVLPVVYLRRRDRKKIAKFDPSKTTHCLKKINVEDSSESVAGLTWSLDLQNDIGGVRSVKIKKERITEIMFDEQKRINGDNNVKVNYKRQKGHEEKHAKKINGPCMFDVTFEDTANNSSDVEYESVESSESDWNHRSFQKADASNRNISSSQNTASISFLSKKKDKSSVQDKVPQRNSKIFPDVNGFESSPSSKMRVGKDNSPHKVLLSSNVSTHEEDNEVFSDEINSMASERQSSKSSDETADSDLNTRKNVSSEHVEETNTDSSSESETEDEEYTNLAFRTRKDNVSSIDSKFRENTQAVHIDPDRTTVRSTKVKDQFRMTNDTTKKNMSNEKRLDALEGKKRIVLAQKSAIKDALKELDSSMHHGKNHIIFSDSDDGEDGDNSLKKAAYSLGEKVSGSKASSWLGLDSDTDEEHVNGSDVKSNQLVTVKPYFEGKAGEELFKLQRTFGGDKRFELDSRFLESEEEDDLGHDAYTETAELEKETLTKYDSTEMSTEVENTTSADLKYEKEMALKVLGNILGGDFIAEFNQESQEKELEFRSSAAVHYDPEREDHKQFEQVAVENKTGIRNEPRSVQEKLIDEPVFPEVSQDKYYEANTSSLAELFGKKKEGGSTFSFLPRETEDDIYSAVADERPTDTMEVISKNPWQTTLLPYDSSSDSDDYDGDHVAVDDTAANGDSPSKLTSHLYELFFFHPDNPMLENRINDEQEPFMRIGSQEDVNQYWLSVRTELTQDYKRKRKDAVRRQNKLAAKRTRRR